MVDNEIENAKDGTLVSEVQDQENFDDDDAVADEREDEDREKEEEDDYFRIKRLAEQLDGPLMLRPDTTFLYPVARQASTIKRDEFSERFEEFLKGIDRNRRELTPEMLNELFDLAVRAQQQYWAWEATVRAVKSKRFRQSVEYVRQKSRWLASIKKMRTGSAPNWVSAWEHIWIEALQELKERIQEQLRGAQSYLETVSEIAKLGRTDIVSHILLSCKPSINVAIGQKPNSRTPIIELAAFAHASKILPFTDDENDAKGRHVNRVKARLSRVADSKAKFVVLTFYLQASSIGLH